MLIFIIAIPIFFTISTYYILQTKKPERKLLAKKIKRLRKRNTALRRKCRKLKVSAEMPYYIIDLRGKIQEEEIKSLKLQLQSQDKLKIENLELKLIVKDLEQKLEEHKIQSEKSIQ